MQIIDLCIATKYLEYAEISQWNMTRQIMLCTLKPYLKKKDMTAQEFFPLPLDDDNNEHRTDITNEEIEWFNKYKNNYIKTKKDSN